MSDRPMHEAARRADVAALRRELAKGVSPNTLDQYGQTPLQLPKELARLVVEYRFHVGYY